MIFRKLISSIALKVIPLKEPEKIFPNYNLSTGP
jgi:hypothetical protein